MRKAKWNGAGQQTLMRDWFRFLNTPVNETRQPRQWQLFQQAELGILTIGLKMFRKWKNLAFRF